MKILLCAGIFPPETGGPATYVRELGESLARRGHKVTVITYCDADKGSLKAEIFPVIKVSRSWFKPWHYYKYYRAVKRAGKSFDLFFAQDPVSSGYPAYLAARVLKKPYVVKVTGDYSWEQAAGKGLTGVLIEDFQKLPSYPFWIRLMRRLQIHVCREARRVITPSEFLRQLVIGWGVKEHRVHLIYNAVNIPSDLPAIPKPAGKFLVLSSGRDVPWKGFSVLREAVAELGEVFELRLTHKVQRKEYLGILKSADVFVLNTGYEGLAHAILEAMALGVPVITTSVGGNIELVRDGKNGISVGFNDKEAIKAALLKLYKEPELQTKLSQAGRETAAKFNKEEMINQTERMLSECVS